MTDFTIPIVGVTAACAIALMLAAGTRYEKLCGALTALAVLLCVLSPIKDLLSEGAAADVSFSVDEAEVEAEQRVIEECEITISRRAAAALREKYPDVGIASIDVTVSKADGEYFVSSYSAELSGDDAVDAREYLEEILGVN